MQQLVHKAVLAKAIDFPSGLRSIICTGEGWTGWSIYSDTKTRELVVTHPPTGVKSSHVKYRIPFENVVCYIAGIETKPAAPNGGWATTADDK